MRFHIDTCSVFRNTVFVSGWSEAGIPSIIYAGQQMESHNDPVVRHDLITHFGEGSECWGFNITAIIPFPSLQHSEITLRFKDGTNVEFPGSKFRSAQDAALGEMSARFTQATKRGGRALEIGSRARSGNSYRHMVHDSVDYVGLDITAGENVDVVGDAHHLSRYVQGRFDFIFSISVFEHLLMPWMVSLEMNKVMNIGGLALIQSHPAWPLHEEPWDFWRFSKDAWYGLFNVHTGFRLIDSQYGMGARIVSDFAAGGSVQGLDAFPTYHLSACLVEKIGDAKVSWEADAGEVYDLHYSHA